MNERFEWDVEKARSNERKHGVSFDEGATVFDDGRSRFGFDIENSATEDRFMIIGYSNRGRLLAVWHTYREPFVRIIGARLATTTERKTYEEERPSRR